MTLQTADPLPHLSELFDLSTPVELEIGCGKGKFILERAEEHPDINFLAVDRIHKWMNVGLRKLERRALPNVKFLRAEARQLLEESIPPASLSVCHIYFPDPWPKRRHRRRRLVNEELLTMVHGRLRQDGLLEIVTDFDDYFEEIRAAVLRVEPAWSSFRESTGERLFEAHLKTNYERKYEIDGRRIFYMELKK
ncbi:MAG: tRNA (guanosine(46)-N7)-methyltransferase TrmB [Candidatus Omnitrophota bacterium]|nr:tRNA (guanosine(46)-N7)-methyltransferase TrmB [Candidatus Omnitrophota bacterium]